MIALCGPRLESVRTRFDQRVEPRTEVVVVLARELVHWVAEAVHPVHSWFEEVTAQIVSRRIIETLPDAKALVAFHHALALKQPYVRHSHLELGPSPEQRTATFRLPW
jgi:hypothetical protein